VDLGEGGRVVAGGQESGGNRGRVNKPDSKKKENKMKKLMIAATAAMAGVTAFGGLCDPEAAGPDSCSVYNIKFTFKTLAAKKRCELGARWLVSDFAPGTEGVWGAKWYRSPAADTAAAADPAGDGTAVTAADYIATGLTVCDNGNGALIANAVNRWVYWMDNATRKFEGIAWQCKSACFEGWFFDCDFTNNGRLNYVLWEKKNSLAISYPVFQVKYGADDGVKFTETPKTLYFSFDAQNEMLIGRYGNKAQKVTAYWWLQNLLHGQSITAAGFGTYDVKNLRTKSISGNAVGMIMPIQDGASDPCGNKGRIFCALGFMCVEWMDWCCDGCYAGVDLVPASGTWSLKYNASATKKANADKATLASFVPNYMFYADSAWAAAKAADPWLHTDNYYWWGSTSLGLLYRENAAVAALNDDLVLDRLAAGASRVIDIVFEGVKTVKKVTVTDDDGNETTKNVIVQVYGSHTEVATDEDGEPIVDEETGEYQFVTVPTEYEVKSGVIVLPETLFNLPAAEQDEEEEEEEEEDL